MISCTESIFDYYKIIVLIIHIRFLSNVHCFYGCCRNAPREKTQLLQLPLRIARALQTNILTLAKTRQIVEHASPQAQQDDRMAKGYVAECYVGQ